MDGIAKADSALFTINNVWMLVSTILVFIMHLGFASLEVGLTRAKNTVNILFKNVSILAIGILTYSICGFNLMYPGSFALGEYFGFGGWGISMPEGPAGLIDYQNGQYTYFTDFIFQAMFAATAATIVSGAIAERMKLSSFLIFTVYLIGLVYPIIGMWKWGGGFLNTLSTPFYDFAGSSIVHSVGGWAALISVILLGPRLGKYVDSRINEIKPHSFALSAIGVFLLWFGWFGFNGFSQLAMGTFDDVNAISKIAVNTHLAGAAGTVTGAIVSRLVGGKTDVIMMLNGALAGLVAITAEPLTPSPMTAIFIGTIGSVIMYFGTKMLENFGLDDVVGAIPVHMFAGIFGTLVVPLTNGDTSFGTQLVGTISVVAFSFVLSYLVFVALKATIGLRISKAAEKLGTDKAEIGVVAYSIRD